MMYHGNVKRRLKEYMPKGYFDWHFEGPFQVVEQKGDEVKLVRGGTCKFDLGYLYGGMFWRHACKNLPRGQNFPFSQVDKFADCKKCPAREMLVMKKGGLSGKGNEWKVVDIIIIKMK